MKRLLLAAVSALISLPCLSAVTLSISPTTQNVVQGFPVSIDVNVAGLGNGVQLGTFDINLAFDASLLSFVSGSFGNQLDLFGLGDISAMTPGTGTVNLLEVSLDSVVDLNSIQAPSFRLATLIFDTLAVGNSSPLILTINALGDASGLPISADTAGAVVSITSNVPEPSTYPIFLLGLAGIGIARLRAVERQALGLASAKTFQEHKGGVAYDAARRAQRYYLNL